MPKKSKKTATSRTLDPKTSRVGRAIAKNRKRRHKRRQKQQQLQQQTTTSATSATTVTTATSGTTETTVTSATTTTTAVNNEETTPSNSNSSHRVDNNAVSTGLSKLQQKMQQKLEGGQFRWLNEHLYTHPSLMSFNYFKENPHLFDIYHIGFRSQVSKWPVHPLSIIIEDIKVGKSHQQKLTIADFGCGDADLAKALGEIHKVQSFDVIAKNPSITSCDIAKVPLEDDSVDIGVYCLSLMGTNVQEILMEGRRVLKQGGELMIAEVKSRFDGKTQAFIKAMSQLGFTLIKRNEDNLMFVLLYFKLSSKKMPLLTSSNIFNFQFKSCKYKKR